MVPQARRRCAANTRFDERLRDCAITDSRSRDIRAIRGSVENPTVVEGAWDGNKVVMVSFPDEASFRRWADSSEYMDIAKDRKASAESVVILVKGIAARTEVARAE